MTLPLILVLQSYLQDLDSTLLCLSVDYTAGTAALASTWNINGHLARPITTKSVLAQSFIAARQ